MLSIHFLKILQKRIKKRAQNFEHGGLLFTAVTAGTVFAIGNEDNAVSGSIGDFVLKGVKFIKLDSVKVSGFSGFKQKIISLYNVYILFSICKEISTLPAKPSFLPPPLIGEAF